MNQYLQGNRLEHIYESLLDNSQASKSICVLVQLKARLLFELYISHEQSKEFGILNADEDTRLWMIRDFDP